MTITEIKELKDMGFTPDQIIALNSPGTSETPAETPADPPAETPADPPADPPAENSDQQSNAGKADDTRLSQLESMIKDQNAKISSLISMVQAGNRQNMSMPTLPDDIQHKTDEVMAELIRPTK